ITTPTSATTTVTGVPVGTSATLRWTLTNPSNSNCTDSDDVSLTNNIVPNCSITGNTFICPGESTAFTANADNIPEEFAQYLWTGPGNANGATTKSVSGLIIPTEYKVKITDSRSGCYSECTRTLRVGGTNVRPNVTPTDYCENDPQKPTTLCSYANVNGVPNATIEWIGATKDGQPYVIQYDQGTGCPLAPTAVGSYQFIVEIKTNDNCVTSFGASTDFNVYPKPTVDAGLSPGALCSQGGSVQLTGSPLGGTWSGSPYITAGGLFTIPNGGISAGNYKVTYTYTSPQENGGCSDSDTVDVPVVDCTECGTAFGVALNANKTAIDELVLDGNGKYVSGTSKCFREDSFRRWGWTNAITPSADPYILDLYRGAGRCLIDKGEYVGYVTVNYGLDNIITVEFTPKDENTGFDEIHLYVGCDPYPKLKTGAYTVAPGQYTFVAEGQGFAEGWSTSTDANKKITVPGGGLVYVIAHTVACTDTSADDAPNGFVPREGYGEFQGNVPTPGEMNCEVVVDPWSKISDTKVTTYPVPFTDQVNVSYKFEYETDVKINVYDMKGALIKQAEDVNYVKGTYGTSTIDLSRANDQMYFIRLTTSKESAVRKVISAKPQK
ncbi:T9SS type A sorting domain-containing protein, partial [Mariniflexile sp. HNIBRBA6329]|uniref:T9SS type A sorting domain-containing protein n=1 Tax=Mariniflexile sp. HNIBRBA6329 TaxID=3373088 RepID=UPI003745BED1